MVIAPNAKGCLLGTWEVIGKKSCGLERICGCLYVHLETILGFTRNEQMGCSEAFRGNASCAKHQGTPRNVSGENISKPKEVQQCPKNSQNWRLQYTLSDFPEARAPNDTGWLLGEWEVIGKESCGMEQICRCIYVLFEAVLGFSRNEQMGCLKGFWSDTNGVKHPRNITSHFSFPRNVSGENMARPGVVKKCTKNNQNWRL